MVHTFCNTFLYSYSMSNVITYFLLSIQWIPGTIPWVNRMRHEADCSPVVKNTCGNKCTPRMSIWCHAKLSTGATSHILFHYTGKSTYFANSDLIEFITYIHQGNAIYYSKVSKVVPVKTYGGVDVYSHILLTSALVGGEWSAPRPGRFTPGTHWIVGWVVPRAGLDNMEKRKFLTPPGLKLQPLGHPACKPVAIPTMLSRLPFCSSVVGWGTMLQARRWHWIFQIT
jgi:hypothetical protein